MAHRNNFWMRHVLLAFLIALPACRVEAKLYAWQLKDPRRCKWPDGYIPPTLANPWKADRDKVECYDPCPDCIYYDVPKNMSFCKSKEYWFDTKATGPSVCTTTTTFTTTTTSTTTSTVTVWTTTLAPIPLCWAMCFSNTSPWVLKCTWSVCQACADCLNYLIATTSQAIASSSFFLGPPPTTALVFPPTTVYRRTTLATTTTFSQTATSSTQTMSSTTAPALTPKGCFVMCYEAADTGASWKLLCVYATCVSCVECFESATTTTTTLPLLFTTYTVTVTGTMTESLFPPTSTTITTWTTSISTTTTSTTSTFTSTLTTRACLPPSAQLRELFADQDNCNSSMSSGQLPCVAPAVFHPCVKPGASFTFECPKNNYVLREPDLKTSGFDSRCKTCGFAANDYNDTDPRGGFIALSLTFGPLAILGRVNESSISGYGIFMVDDCLRPLRSSVLGYISTLPPDTFRPDCCVPTAYTIDLEFQLPPNAKSAVLIIRPNTSFGFLPVGDTTPEIFDLNTTNGFFNAHAVRCTEMPFVHRLLILVVMSWIIA